MYGTLHFSVAVNALAESSAHVVDAGDNRARAVADARRTVNVIAEEVIEVSVVVVVGFRH
jgi:hypothetical protein